MNLAAAVATMVLTITTQNIRQGLPPDAVRHDLRQAAEHSSIVVTQEMGYRNAKDYRPRGWGSAHNPHGKMRGDCATYWDRDVWRLDRWRTKQITYAPFRNGDRWVLLTILHRTGRKAERVAVVCVHSITRSEQRDRVFRAGMRRLGHLLDNFPDMPVVVGGDWNRVWSLRARFPGYRSVSPIRATGPQGGRVDYFEWHHATFRGERIIGNTRSDHNGTRVHLGLSW